MSPTALAFPDTQVVLATLLQSGLAGLPAKRAGGVRPAAEALKKSLPYVVTYRIGGSDDGITDSAVMVVEVYADKYAVGQPLAEQARACIAAAPLLVAMPGGRTVVIDDTATLNSPFEVPYSDATVRLWTATYRLAARRQRAA